MFIDVSYKDNWAISYSRQARFGMRDFIGKCTGTSALIITLIVYHYTDATTYDCSDSRWHGRTPSWLQPCERS